MLHVVLWKWKDVRTLARAKYEAVHVNTVAAMVRRNMPAKYPYRIICITDDPAGVKVQTYPLWKDCSHIANATKQDLPSCYRRLKLYDPATQASLEIKEGDRILGLDVDCLVMKDLSGIVERTMSFRYMGWAVRGALRPKVFNGSLQMFTAGDLSEIWSSFDPETSPKQAFEAKFFGSDQSWLSMNLIGKEGCDGFTWPTVASYAQETKKTQVISAQTHITFFNGQRKPWQPVTYREASWVLRYWRN